LSQTLRALPGSLFGAVMGLAGFGLACRSAQTLLPLPGWFAETWIALAALALAVLLPAYLLKLLRHPQAVREELANPATLGFCAALPVGLTLVAGGLQPHAAGLAQALWWAGAALLAAIQLRMFERLLRGGIVRAQVNGGWMIALVGGIVLPTSGLPLGNAGASLWFFGFSAIAAPFVMGLVLRRLLAGPPLPDAARPSWFILVVPPALIYLNAGLLSGAPAGPLLEGLFLCGLPLAAALLYASRGMLRWPFGAPWWAFTFPLDALAAAATQFARDHPLAPWRWLAGALLVLAGFFVTWVLLRTLMALARGTLFLPPPAPKQP
jgi:tellurite resistance protein